MAAFHYKLEVVPKYYFGELLPTNVPLHEVEEGLSPWTSPPYPSNKFIAELRCLLPVNKSWGETEEYVSGSDYSSDVRIWRENGKIENIEFRYNPHCEGWSLMQKFLQIVNAESCVLIETRTGAVLLPEEAIIRDRINAVAA
jgi:hypothetical protein